MLKGMGIDPAALTTLGKDVGTALADFKERLIRIEAKLDALSENKSNGQGDTGFGSADRGEGAGRGGGA